MQPVGDSSAVPEQQLGWGDPVPMGTDVREEGCAQGFGTCSLNTWVQPIRGGKWRSWSSWDATSHWCAPMSARAPQDPRLGGYSSLDPLLLCSSPLLLHLYNRAERASISVSLAGGAGWHNLVIKNASFIFKYMVRLDFDPVVNIAHIFCYIPLLPHSSQSYCAGISNALFLKKN